MVIDLKATESLPDTGCLLCGGIGKSYIEDGRDYWVRGGASERFAVRYCASCQIGYTLPRMNEEVLASYYPSGYEPFGRNAKVVEALLSLKHRGDLRSIVRELGRGRGSLFEIGAGNGAFLKVAQKYGFAVSGMEPSAYGRAWSQSNFGIELEGGLASCIHYSQRHDVVVARHVLEHLNDARQCLESVLREGLKPGGLLYIKVPRLNSWEAKAFGAFWDGHDLPRHRLHFSTKGIAALLQQIGFVDINVRAEIVPLPLKRSMEYYGKHGAGSGSRLAFLFSALPSVLRIGACQVAALTLSPLGSGRMIVFARRPQ